MRKEPVSACTRGLSWCFLWGHPRPAPRAVRDRQWPRGVWSPGSPVQYLTPPFLPLFPRTTFSLLFCILHARISISLTAGTLTANTARLLLTELLSEGYQVQSSPISGQGYLTRKASCAASPGPLQAAEKGHPVSLTCPGPATGTRCREQACPPAGTAVSHCRPRLPDILRHLPNGPSSTYTLP